MADRPDRGPRRAEVPLPPMPAAWHEPAEEPAPSPPSVRRSAVPAPPRPPVMLPPMMRAPVPPPVGPRQPPPPAGFYGPPPYAAPIPGTGTYNVPPMAGQRVIYPAQATVVPVSAPRSRPLSPIPYPGLPPASAPPVAAHLPPYDHADKAMSDRSGLTAGLLQIFLGYFGAGRLYTGHVAIALLQLSTVWFTFGVTVCLGVGFGDGGLWPMMLISLIWPVVDGFVMISGGQRDSEGRRLR